MKQKTKRDLSAPQQRLLTLIGEIGFGRMEGLAVRDGMPVFDPGPVIFREIKFGGKNGSNRPRPAADFILKTQAVELFGHLQRVGSGLVVQKMHILLPVLPSVADVRGKAMRVYACKINEL